jgi:hypothetical protein
MPVPRYSKDILSIPHAILNLFEFLVRIRSWRLLLEIQELRFGSVEFLWTQTFSMHWYMPCGSVVPILDVDHTTLAIDLSLSVS